MRAAIIISCLSALALSAAAVPVIPQSQMGVSLHKRSRCAGGGEAPCVCAEQFGLRADSTVLAGRCQEVFFQFKDAASTTDGTLKIISPFTAAQRTAITGANKPQCDHIIELQFIATLFQTNSAACQKLAQPGVMSQFREAINSVTNTVFVEPTVNNAKGTIASGGTKKSDAKATAGVVDYLNKLKLRSPPLRDAALAGVILSAREILGPAAAGTVTDLYNTFLANLEQLAANANQQAAALGGTSAACKRDLPQESLYSFLKRALTTGELRRRAPACALPAAGKSTSVTPAAGKPALRGAANTVPLAGNSAPKGVNAALPKPLRRVNTAPAALGGVNAGQRATTPPAGTVQRANAVSKVTNSRAAVVQAAKPKVARRRLAASLI